MIVVLVAIVGCAHAVETDGEATIVEGSEKVAEYFTNTGYDYKFKTSNNIVKEETADFDKNIVKGFVLLKFVLWEIILLWIFLYFQDHTNTFHPKVSFIEAKFGWKFNSNYLEFTGRTIKVTYTAGAGNKDGF